MRSTTVKPSRRALLGGAAASITLFAFHLPVRAANEPEQVPGSTSGKFAPNAFIRLAPDGKTTLVMPQVEMGQGVYTAIAMIPANARNARMRCRKPSETAPTKRSVIQPNVRLNGRNILPSRPSS